MYHSAYTGPGRDGAQEGGTAPVAGKAQKQEEESIVEQSTPGSAGAVGWRTELQDAQCVPLARQGGVPASGLSGAQPAGTQPQPSPSELPPRAKGTTLGANLGHSLQILIRFLPRTVMEWKV